MAISADPPPQPDAQSDNPSSVSPEATIGSTKPAANSAPEMPIVLQPGARPMPDYVLVRKLGAGGFGEVWHAQGPGGIDVALKIIRLDAQGSAMEVRSLEVMKTIRHPNLVGLFGVWRKDNLLIFAMELCEGSLHDRLEEARADQQTGIPAVELLTYMRDAARGIDVLNKQNVQHRDIKPMNLLLLKKGVKVADFGLAKILEGSGASHTGAMTPSYAAPECFRGKVANESDQYSLAATYYHLRTGKLVFSGSLEKIMHGHLKETPDLSRLPAAEQPVVARALAKKPDKRWPSCRAFVHALIQAHQTPIAPVAEAQDSAEPGVEILPVQKLGSKPAQNGAAPAVNDPLVTTEPAPNGKSTGQVVPAGTTHPPPAKRRLRVLLMLLGLVALIALNVAAVIYFASPGDVQQSRVETDKKSPDTAKFAGPVDSPKTQSETGKLPLDSGKTPPDSGKSPPDSGKTPPDTGKSPTDIGKPVPATDSGKKPIDVQAAVRQILKEIEYWPPTTGVKASPIDPASMPEFNADLLEAYKPDYASILDYLDKAKQFPLRAAVARTVWALRENVSGVTMRNAVPGNLAGKQLLTLKNQVKMEEDAVAKQSQALKDMAAQLAQIDSKQGDAETKRWQVLLDYSLLRLKARVVHLDEYVYNLGLIRTDSLPPLAKGETLFRLTPQERVSAANATAKQFVQDLQKGWPDLAKTHAGTPWAVLALREPNVLLGLVWRPTRE